MATENEQYIEFLNDLIKRGRSSFMERAKKNPNLGHPKFAVGDYVEFEAAYLHDHDEPGGTDAGAVMIVDAYGTFEQNEEPSYDIFIKERNLLVKHVRESSVIRKIRPATEDDMAW